MQHLFVTAVAVHTHTQSSIIILSLTIFPVALLALHYQHFVPEVEEHHLTCMTYVPPPTQSVSLPKFLTKPRNGDISLSIITVRLPRLLVLKTSCHVCYFFLSEKIIREILWLRNENSERLTK
jgi:hypothetical protein